MNMRSNPSENEDVITALIEGWEENAPETTFAEMTLAQFKVKVKASLDARERIKVLVTQLQAARVDRDNADVDSKHIVLNVVNSVRGDPGYGEDSALYASFGYVGKSDRKSGLTRASQETPAQPSATLKAA